MGNKTTMIPPVRVEAKLRADSTKAAERRGWTLALVIRSALSAFSKNDSRIIAIIEEELQKK